MQRVSIRAIAISLSHVLALATHAETFVVSTPGGDVEIDVTHAGPQGGLVRPEAPRNEGFRPPTIFAAPLPSGSGARALGLAGAFTAVADDATAASWNPAGLMQLERPEASAVYRFATIKNDHHSGSDDFLVGHDEFSNDNLNYFSLVLPFAAFKREFVLSLNYQEAYDFTQQFNANVNQNSSRTEQSSSSGVFTETTHFDLVDDEANLDINTFVRTETRSALSQVLQSELLTDLHFEQEGTIDAFSPSIAMEITPTFSIGMTLNQYGNDMLRGRPIRSHTTARYEGNTSSRTAISTLQTTESDWEFQGTVFVTIGPDTVSIPVSDSGTFPAFSDTSVERARRDVVVEGEYEEINEFSELEGFNATFGMLWTLSKLITIGASIDLPWTADAKQEKTVRSEEITYDASKTRVLDTLSVQSVEKKDIELSFPMYWAVGLLFRWTDSLHTAIDVSQTLWSDFAFEAEGEPKLNPLDGSPHGENALDDTWALRYGMEYLFLFDRTEVPVRCGVFWEQRPAVGEPDEFWGFSLGTGFSIGQDPGKFIIDVAYVYREGQDVQGALVPGESDFGSDVVEHQVFVSAINHF